MSTSSRALWSLLAVLGALVASATGQAQIIDLYGDLGTGTTLGTPFSPVNSTFTQSFSQSTLAGNITGDVIVSNDPTGSIFDMTITNLTYNCIIPNGSGFGDVTVQVLHTYVTGGGGSYTGSQSMAGTWTSGPLSVVQLDSIQDYANTNVFLPSLVATSSPFNLGPVSGTVLSLAPTYQILANLRLHTDGVGAVNLPSSVHIHVELVPGPGGCGVLAFAGLMGMRRRRAA